MFQCGRSPFVCWVDEFQEIPYAEIGMNCHLRIGSVLRASEPDELCCQGCLKCRSGRTTADEFSDVNK